MSSLRRSATTLLVMVAMLVLASGCRLVGSGTLGYVPNPDESAATSGSVATIHAFRPNPGDAWPPPRMLALWVRADHIPQLNAGVAPGSAAVYFWRLKNDLPEYGMPRTCEEIPAQGLIVLLKPAWALHIGEDRTVNEVLLVDDTPENQDASWVIARETSNYGWFVPIRCGALPVAP